MWNLNKLRNFRALISVLDFFLQSNGAKNFLPFSQQMQFSYREVVRGLWAGESSESFG